MRTIASLAIAAMALTGVSAQTAIPTGTTTVPLPTTQYQPQGQYYAQPQYYQPQYYQPQQYVQQPLVVPQTQTPVFITSADTVLQFTFRSTPLPVFIHSSRDAGIPQFIKRGVQPQIQYVQAPPQIQYVQQPQVQYQPVTQTQYQTVSVPYQPTGSTTGLPQGAVRV
jgi:hypothetical protein